MSKWEWKKLGEVCEIVGGSTPKTGVEEYWNGKNIWITPAEIGRDLFLNDSVRHISDAAVKSANLKLMPAGTVILSSRAPIGKLAISNVPFYCNQGFKNAICGDLLNNKFLFFYLLSSTAELESLGKGTTFKEISKTIVENFPVPVPPLSEQKRIVKFLDNEFSKIDTLKTNAETNLKNAKELFETTLEKELNPLSRHSERSEESSADLPFGWEWKKMRDVCEVTSSKRIFKDEYVKRGIPFYRTKEIKELSHGEPLSLELFISEEKYNQIKQKFGVPQIGDVLISAVGTIGEILVISNNNPFYFKDGNIIWLKNISLFDSIFLKYELKSIIDSLKAMTRGAAYNALTIEKLKECKIPLPPLSVQKEIVARLDKLSENVKRLEANYKQIIANCDELKKSILKKTFQNEN
jgi:type I restriction enzyme S subunit